MGFALLCFRFSIFCQVVHAQCWNCSLEFCDLFLVGVGHGLSIAACIAVVPAILSSQPLYQFDNDPLYKAKTALL